MSSELGLLKEKLSQNKPVEGEPLDVFTQHQTRRHEELSEVECVNSFFFVFFELEAGVL